MQATKRRPATPGQREMGPKQKRKISNRPSYHNKPSENFKRKSHWSRGSEQRRRDAAVLASVGLVLKQVPGADFYRFAPASSQELEAAS